MHTKTTFIARTHHGTIDLREVETEVWRTYKND